MKKFLRLFFKGKKKQGGVRNLYEVSLLDNVNSKDPQKNVYKSYEFDFDCFPSTGCSTSLDLKVGGRNSLASSSGSHIFSSSLTDLEADGLQFEKDIAPQESYISKSSSTSSVSEVFSPVKQEQKKPHFDEMKKSRKQMYVITINNSKHFHIGSQKTVNIFEKVLPSMQDRAQPCDGFSSELEANLSKLLDCEDKLTEEYILLISKYASDKWKEFLRNLGLENTFIEVLEARNDNSRSLTVYDCLQEYISLYPNTSLGFIIDILRNTQQLALVEKLTQEMKKNNFNI